MKYFLFLLLFVNCIIFPQELTADANTLLLLNFNNNVIGAQGQVPTLSSNILYETGIFGQGFYAGTGNRLYFGSSNNINAAQGTVEFWVKPKWNGNNGLTNCFFSWGNNFYVLKDGGNNLRFIINNDDSEANKALNISNWKANEWHHIAISWTIPGTMKTYVDGLLVFSNNASSSDLFTNTSSQISIGSRLSSNIADAVFDEFRISNIQRADSEIALSFINNLSISDFEINIDTNRIYKTWTIIPKVKAVTIEGTKLLIANNCGLWQSSNTNIAEVDNNGKITAKTRGDVNISFTYKTIIKNISLTVVEPVLQSFEEEVVPYLSTPAPNCVYTIPVVILRYIPTKDGIYVDNGYVVEYDQNTRVTLVDKLTEIRLFEKRIKFMLEEGSKFHGYKDSTARPSIGYKIIKIITYYEPFLKDSKYPDQPDYNFILGRIDSRNYVEQLGVKEFWVWGYHPQPESNMSSSLTGNISNSFRHNDDKPEYQNAYTVYGYNFARTQNEAVHNHGHQLESILSYAQNKQDHNSYVFGDSYMGAPRSGRVLGRGGNTHCPPNTIIDYDYRNPTLVLSDCEDWNPLNTGNKKYVNVDTWANLIYSWPDADPLFLTQKTDAQYYIYWMQNMPGYANQVRYGSNWMTNWWEFTADWDKAIKSNTGLYASSPSTYITLSSPNGGENWRPGTVHSILWSSVNISNIKIEYSIDNGLNWLTVASSTPANPSSYNWTVPNVNSINCRIRISDASNLSVNAFSFNSFVITSASSVNLSSPIGGEVWKAGSIKAITWSSLNVDNIKIELSTNNGASWNIIASNLAAISGSYSWILPIINSSQCLIKISDLSNPSISSVSICNFSIRIPSDVKITLFLHMNNNPNGEYGEAPNISSNLSYEAGIFDQGVFINNGTQLTYPNSGYLSATEGTVEFWIKPKWNGNNGVTNCFFSWGDLFFVQKDGGNNLRFIINNDDSEAYKSFNLGAWRANEWHHIAISWTIPGTMKTYVDGVLRISNNSSTQDLYANINYPICIGSKLSQSYANAIFDDIRFSSCARTDQEIRNSYLAGVPSISVTYPAGGERFIAGTTQNITWNSSNVNKVKIEYSSNNGIAWNTIISSVTAVQGSYSWNTPLVYSTQCKIRISDTSNAAISSSSNIFSIITRPGQPVLLTPANGSINQPITLYLTWNQITGAESYRLQVSTDVNFNSLIFNDSTITGTTKQITGMLNSQTYYWRVNARNIGGASDWSTVWNFTTITAKPVQPVLLSPVSGAQNQPATIQLSWNQTSGVETYRLQVSTDANFGNLIFNDSTLTGTTKQITGLVNSQTYYWRVNAKNIGGTSDWSTVWNFTTITAKPVQPVLLSPVSGAQNQPTTLLLSWNQTTGAETYRLQVSTDANFGNVIFNDSTLTGTTKQITGLINSQTYYWRVNARNIGGTSDWSAVWSFSTITANPLQPILLSPLNGVQNQPISVILSWYQLSSAESYRLQVSTDVNFNSLIFSDSTLTGTTKQITGLVNSQTYYWRVNAKNIGGTSDWSTVWNFTTITAKPVQPVLLSPVSGAQNQPTTLLLSWNQTTGAETYRLQVSTDANFGNVIFNDSTLIGTTKQITGLINSQTYYWRVNAKNIGGTSDWSAIWNFTTITAKPVQPVLLSPSNGAQNQPATIQLSWNQTSGAETYRLQVSTDANFGNVIFNDSTLIGTTKQITGLINSQTYYWRVNAKNIGGTSDWSTVWSFTIVKTKPSQPILLNPANGSENLLTQLTLTWNPVNGADTYCLQISTDVNFSNLIFADSTLLLSSKQISGLNNSTTYFWRVNGKNIGGISNWSIVWNFKTIGCAITGRLIYGNNEATPLKNVTVKLKNNNVSPDSSITDSNGRFEFFQKAPGTYDLQFSNKIVWGGANATDALLVMRHYTRNLQLTGIKFKSADVNNSGEVNSTDALAILERYAGITNSFQVGDWVYDNTSVIINRGDTNIVVQTLCAGDIDASYLLLLAKKNSPIMFEKLGEMSCTKNSIVNIPICVDRDVTIGAVSLILTTPFQDNELIGTESALSNKIVNVFGNKIIMVWADLKAFHLNKGDPLLIVKYKPKNNLNKSCKFECDPTSEIANAEGKIINELKFTYPEISEYVPSKFKLDQNYPNPFNPSTNINWSIPQNAQVKLKVFDILGNEVAALVDEFKQVGTYNTIFDARHLSSGVYYYRLIAGSFIETRKMILIK